MRFSDIKILGCFYRNGYLCVKRSEKLADNCYTSAQDLGFQPDTEVTDAGISATRSPVFLDVVAGGWFRNGMAVYRKVNDKTAYSVLTNAIISVASDEVAEPMENPFP